MIDTGLVVVILYLFWVNKKLSDQLKERWEAEIMIIPKVTAADIEKVFRDGPEWVKAPAPSVLRDTPGITVKGRAIPGKKYPFADIEWEGGRS